MDIHQKPRTVLWRIAEYGIRQDTDQELSWGKA